jgi:Mg-chelatase subunit ChlI
MPGFPFPALVGQEDMKLALLLNAVNPAIGGVLIRGHRGTAKTTAVRALARVLPDLPAVEGCRFHCDPSDAHAWCDECRARLKGPGEVPTCRWPARVVELPVSASEDRLVGSLDLERALQRGERSFHMGLLGEANRGLLYVDEVNLLDDHLVDALLDAAATGVNVVEREGISFRHPARFVLIGTMNPEEGELRPQLLDRFGLSVDVTGIRGIQDRVEIARRTLAWEGDPDAFLAVWAEAEVRLRERIARARALLPKVSDTPELVASLAVLTAEAGTEGHRADIVALRAARAAAALEGRGAVDRTDLLRVLPLVLGHRLPTDAAGEPEIDRLTHLDERLRDAERAGRTASRIAEPEKKTPDAPNA